MPAFTRMGAAAAVKGSRMYKHMAPFYTLTAALILAYLVFATWCTMTLTAT